MCMYVCVCVYLCVCVCLSQCRPIVINARDFSPMIRARYYWGNLPAMYWCVPLFLLVSYLNMIQISVYPLLEVHSVSPEHLLVFVLYIPLICCP